MPKNESAARGARTRGDRTRSERSIDVHDAALTLFAERGYHGTSMKDIAAALHLRAPSLYNHVSAKQEILRDVMVETMNDLLKVVRSAMAGTDDTVLKLRRAAEAHVRYHARHPREVRIGNHEIPALEEPHRSAIAKLRREYSRMFVALIERGVEEAVFTTRSPLLSAYAILQMGIGVSMWYRPDGPLSEDEIVFHYGDTALGVVGGVSGRAGAPATEGAKRPPKRAVGSQK
ncbi:MAG: TetR family transcriptional regulator [Labilithrix sp.]|nr:TetR family transcriptional regulator [Labilithrix sp.]